GKLLWGNLRQRPLGMLLTALAIMASSCLVVWVVSGYQSLVQQFESFSEEYLGRYDLVIVPSQMAGPNAQKWRDDLFVSDDIVAALRDEPLTAEVEPIMQTEALVLPPGEKTPPIFWSPTLIGTQAVDPPFAMKAGNWIDASTSQMQGAISSEAAESLGVSVNQRVTVVTKAGQFSLRIVGIVEQAKIAKTRESARWYFDAQQGPLIYALYVPFETAVKLSGTAKRTDFINVRLQDSHALAEFEKRWATRLAELEIPLEILATPQLQAEMSANRPTRQIRSQAYSATGLSLLTALFIVFTTLSMGVQERSRQLAILRAVAFSRRQVAALIVAEALVLSLAGWGGGLFAGWLLLLLIGEPGANDTIGPLTIALAGVGALGGAIFASIIPAYQASRSDLLDAMTQRGGRLSWRWFAMLSLLGGVLLSINPWVVFSITLADDLRYIAYLMLGCTSMAIGMLLLTPGAVLLVEKLGTPLVARLFSLNKGLLRSQLSGNLWRTCGTAAALSLGLGLFIAVQIWGHSMLAPFVPGQWVPDMILSFQSGGLDDADVARLRQTPGLAASECLPLAIEQPKLASDVTQSQRRGASVARQDNVVLIGIDPQKGLGGENPLLDFTLVAGDRAAATRKVADGRGCIIPDHFAKAANLKLGDVLRLQTLSGEGETVDYEIAAIAELPGWHWMTKFSGFRRRDPRSAAMVFASFDNVRNDYDLKTINYFWTNVDGSRSLDEIGASLEPLANAKIGKRQPVNAQGAWGIVSQTYGPSLRITTTDAVKQCIHANAAEMIGGMGRLPLITLIVASIAVMNTISSSIRVRSWEMGVLRSLGVTRFALMRLVLSEAVLIGIVASTLSLTFGVVAGLCGTGISQSTSFFGGLDPSLVIPWRGIFYGFGVTLLLCLVAAVWPAIIAGRTEPLRLLSQDRLGG
ncbi:MAG: ABC transporter permease, partial [Blastopirellula sp. JB062]